jgi:SAM-dependent methyltransferase
MELASFQTLWRGGYYEGDPLDPTGMSNYGPAFNFMGILHVTYLVCIKPWVTRNSTVLEIGPGRGGWTKCILTCEPRHVCCLDALPADHNHFWEYLHYPENVRYYQVSDFECNELPDDTFDFLFSFGCFCHISRGGIERYLKNLHRKLRPGAHAFVMISDYDKYNAAMNRRNTLLRSVQLSLPLGRLYAPVRILSNALRPFEDAANAATRKRREEDHNPRPGRWHHLGVKETCSLLHRYGYKVLDPDVGVNYRDPVVHFLKP